MVQHRERVRVVAQALLTLGAAMAVLLSAAASFHR
jgi:hypothetical protein